jgi:hypothetical protein
MGEPHMTPPLPTFEQWSSAIGRYILNFGMLDLLLQDFLQSILPPEEFSRLRDGHFQDRVKRLKDHLTKVDQPPKKKALAQFFERLEPARQLRNHIAHGLLRIGLAGDKKTWTHTLSLPKDLDGAGARQARHLTYQGLLKAGTELTQLIEDFKSLSGNWVVDADVSF